MYGSPYYPDGVTDADIDRYFGSDAECSNCRFFSYGVCTKKEDAYTGEELDEMSDDEYKENCIVEDDDYCDDYESNEEERWG